MRHLFTLRLLFSALLLAWGSLGLSGASARGVLAQGAAQSTNNLAASLIADGEARAGSTFHVAIRFEPVSDEWHGYWRNPGDAGYGMELEWALPPGWTVGEPLYPVPRRLLIGGLMNHVYEGDYAVLVPVTVPRETADAGNARGGADRATIGLIAQWLACTDAICVPEQARLQTSVTLGGMNRNASFGEWLAAIPPVLDKGARFAVAGDVLRLAIPLPASAPLTEPHVYVGERDIVRYAAMQTFTRKGDWLIATIPLAPGAQSNAAVSGILAFEDGRGVRFSATAGAVPGDGVPIEAGSENTPDLALLILAALAGGLILNIMPCVFPILSLKALSLARAGTDEAQARREGVAYTAGVVLACVALGVLMLALRAGGEQIGWAFQLQEPWVVVALLLLAAIITANLAGLFELPAIAPTRRGGPAGAFATGLLAAVVATPCTGPFMAAALGAALLLPTGPALLLFASLGLGLALPFLAIGLIPALRRRLPRPGAWMERFRRLLAIPMGLTALALVWLTGQLGGRTFATIALVMVAGVVAGLWVTGKLQHNGRMAWPAFGLVAVPFLVLGGIALPNTFDAAHGTDARSILSPMPYSAHTLSQAQARARRDERPVFLWFTADWCVTCKVNESVAIEREATRAAFADAGVIAIRGDWTRRDADITRYLAQQGVAGIPLYVWYDTDGRKTVLPQVLAPDALVRRARDTR